jgi:hypothetical protein
MDYTIDYYSCIRSRHINIWTPYINEDLLFGTINQYDRYAVASDQRPKTPPRHLFKTGVFE